MLHLRNRLLLYSLILSTTVVFSQKLYFRNFSVEEGLSQSTVLRLYQDKFSNLWVGTQEGVAKFNGKEFINYDTRNGLRGNHVCAILQDNKYRFWFGHSNEGLSLFDNGAFLPISLPENLMNNIVANIIQDRYNTIWVATSDHGIYLITEIKNGVFNFRNLTTENGLHSNNINDLIISDNQVWAASDDGILIISIGNIAEKCTLKQILTIEDGLLDNTIKSLAQDNEGNIWAISSLGLNKITKNDKNFKITSYTFDFPTKLEVVNQIVVDSSNNIWGATFSGLFKFDGINYSLYNQNEGLPDDNLYTVIEDNEGSIWIGSSYFGIFQYTGEKFLIFNESTGLVNDQVNTIMEDNEGNVWIGTENGIDIFDGKTHKYLSEKDGIKSNSINALFQDSKGNIWIGSYNGIPLQRYDPVSKALTNYTTEDGLNSNFTVSINESKDGGIWFASLGQNTAKYTYPTATTKEKFEIYTIENGICSDVIWTIHKDKYGNLWFGSDDSGITKYDGAKFLTYNKMQGLTNNRAAAITHDSKNNIWIATIGSGICKFDGDTFYNYGIEQGLSSESPFSIICDNNDVIWVGTNNGIDMLDTIENKFIHYGKEDGFIGIENNQNSIMKDSHGSLWFGTIKGVIKVNPDKFYKSKKEPELVLEKIQLFYEEFDYLQYSDSLNYKTKLPVNLKLPYKQNHLTFYFNAVSFISPHKIIYKCMLDGFDKDWNPVNKTNKIVYTNLPSGKYTFKFVASNSDGHWSSVPFEFKFEIMPPFWQRTWFYIIVICFAIFLFNLIIYKRTSTLSKAKELLQLKVEKRTIEILKQKEEIESQRDKLKKLNSELKYQQLQILEQNEELKQQKEEILAQRDEIEKKTEILKKSNKLIENKNKHITDSIRYAKRIQEAILPQEQKISSLLKEHFIMYLPKDIVSGDFYWFDKQNEIIYIAAVDCTGHGVPGAFMSIIGYNLLNQALNEYKYTLPSDILNFISKNLKSTLNQSTFDNSVKAGMAITLCAINYKTLILQYASAQSSFVRVSEGKIHHYKGENYPIGYIDDEFNSYTTKEIKIKYNDLIYIFSDGFVDQFGGPYKRKLLYRRFKHMLIEVETFPLQKQKEHLLYQFQQWKGEIEQIDDMLLIGIKI